MIAILRDLARTVAKMFAADLALTLAALACVALAALVARVHAFPAAAPAVLVGGVTAALAFAVLRARR